MKKKSPSFLEGEGLAFTLMELLVVIAVIAILAALLLPALEGAERRAKLAQCQNNFHQIYVACFVYANSYNDYFPICQSGLTNGQDTTYSGIGMPQFSSFVVMSASGKPLNPAHTPVKPGFQSRPGLQNLVFDCLGYLYETKLIGDGKILYCPGFPQNSLSGPAQFSNPSFMSTGGSGEIADTVLFNPQIDDPFCTNLTTWVCPRLFPKTSSLIPGRLFAMDCLQAFNNGLWTLGGGFTPKNFAHYPSRGFDVLFTDGSVKFVHNRLAYDLAVYGVPGNNGELSTALGVANRSQYTFLFRFLEGRPPQTTWDWTKGGHYP